MEASRRIPQTNKFEPSSIITEDYAARTLELTFNQSPSPASLQPLDTMASFQAPPMIPTNLSPYLNFHICRALEFAYCARTECWSWCRIQSSISSNANFQVPKAWIWDLKGLYASRPVPAAFEAPLRAWSDDDRRNHMLRLWNGLDLKKRVNPRFELQWRLTAEESVAEKTTEYLRRWEGKMEYVRKRMDGAGKRLGVINTDSATSPIWVANSRFKGRTLTPRDPQMAFWCINSTIVFERLELVA